MIIIYFTVIGFIIIIDQLSKHYALLYLDSIKTKEIIKNLFYLKLIINRGAAYGILKDRQKLIIAVTAPIIILLNYYLIEFLKEDGPLLLKLALTFLIGGGFSNLLDRIRHHHVIDFLYINLKGWPIFNVADIFILFGALMIIYIELFTPSAFHF